MSEVIGGMFDKLYGANDQTVTEEKKPLIKKALKRKFYAAYDNAESQKLDLQNRISDLRQNFDNLDINRLIESSAQAEGFIKAQAVIKNEFNNMFGEAMDTSRD